MKGRVMRYIPFLFSLALFSSAAKEDDVSCFCQLDGLLEDCPCEAATVDTFNSELRPQLLPILSSYYFRYFQVDFSRPCTFFEDGDGHCGSSACAVDTCKEDQVPDSLKGEHEHHQIPQEEEGFAVRVLNGLVKTFPIFEPYYASTWSQLKSWGLAGRSCRDADPYPVDATIPKADQPLLNDFCPLDPLEDGASCQYVDLIKNTERLTGYSGRSANVVWEKVYNELCFQPEKDGKSLELTSDNMKSMCFEKRAFYRVVSGLHASISVHIAANYFLQEPNFYRSAVWGKNIEEFRRRFSPSTTQNEGPERLKNLYFLYLLELRALAKAAPIFQQIHFNSGKLNVDEDIKASLNKVLAKIKEFPSHFDETVMFTSEESQELKASFKDNFSDISRLMDCLGCERCKVWGKLQITGIGTALKILFTDISSLSLTRHELVALLNAFGRISTSIHELNDFRQHA